MRSFKVSLSAALLVLPAMPSLACSGVPSRFPTPFEERIARSPLVFVGSVEAVDLPGDAVTFLVERHVRGDRPGPDGHITVPAPRSTRDPSFKVGQRWLYVGGGDLSRSLLLNAPGGQEVNRLPDGLSIPGR